MFLAVGCHRKETVHREPTAPAAIDASPIGSGDLEDADAAAEARVSAWTDAPIVERLEADCAFDPRKLSDGEKKELFGETYGAERLACTGNAFDQSCVYDPCFSGDSDDCKRDCLKTCGTCSNDCAGSCIECKTECKDDACKNGCAKSCAQCKQTCLTDQDQCRSGKCTEVYFACRKKLSADWKAQHCAAICSRFAPCRDACTDRALADKKGTFDNDACVAKCKLPLKSTCDFGLCGGKYGMGIQVNGE